MRTIKRFLLMALLAVLALPAAAQRATVGILQFNNAAGVDISVANALADMLTTELVKTGKFEVVERTALASIADEQNLGASGAIDAATAARIGKLKGADYMLLGTVTESGAKSNSGGFGGIRFGGSKVSLAIDVRFTDTSSGSIVFADTYREEDRANKVGLGTIDVNQANATGGELGRTVVQAITERIILSTYPPTVAAYTPGNNEVILNYGGDLYSDVAAWDVYRKGQEIKDPVTGQSLGFLKTVVGRIQVTRSEDRMTYGRLTSGEAVVGDLCRPAEGAVRASSRRSQESAPRAGKDSKEDGGEKRGLFGRLKEKMKNE